MIFNLFVSCAKGLEYLLEDELRRLGFVASRVTPNGVYGEANLALIYNLCIWSRLASRVQLILFSGIVNDEKNIYHLCNHFSWEAVFNANKTLAIEFHGSSSFIRNSMFGAQLIKDAIVDRFRDVLGVRPSIERSCPQILIHAHLKHHTLTVSLDMVGYSLHQRGYRIEAGNAPLKENLAAAMLARANWHELAKQGYALHDPFCGSGTLVIEAAMIAANMAPGLLREDQSLQHWNYHLPQLWNDLRLQAQTQRHSVVIQLSASDIDPLLIAIASNNAERAGVLSMLQLESKPIIACKASHPHGLLIMNPPYGERLGEFSELTSLYQEIGQTLYQNYSGWQAAFLCSEPLLAKAVGLRSYKQYRLYNGALECKLYCLELTNNQLRDLANDHWSPGAQMFANRLQKNYSHLQKWANKKQVSCYRVYDADLPEYSFAIDIYNDHVVLQEYVAPASIDTKKVEQRSLEVLQVVPRILKIAAKNIVVKKRQQQKGINQYEKIAQTQKKLMVNEGRAKLLVNVHDYLDTGLFLDHRLLRFKFAKLAVGIRFLNCFCYTATASIHAALAGAVTTNVDLSNTYLSWAKDNFMANQLPLASHRFIQFDCMKWLHIAHERFDVIFLDPPSFSNSKRMTTTLDIQRDHESLIHAAVALLAEGGLLYFSTNMRQFKLSATIFDEYRVADISHETIDVDFKRNARIHQCFIIQRKMT